MSGTITFKPRVSLIFPHQLFEDNPALEVGVPVFIIEEFLFFRQYKFHKQKILFHRASMKAHEQFLNEQGYSVTYVESSLSTSDIRQLIPYLQQNGVSEIVYCDTTDNWLEQRINNSVLQYGIHTIRHESPMFVTDVETLGVYFNGKRSFFQADFYIHQRKRLNILVDKSQKPEGGKWSWDADNRLTYPKSKLPPKISFPIAGAFREEASTYVTNNFADHYGKMSPDFSYPVTFAEAKEWFYDFLLHRFDYFGEYEDAIVAHEHILHHSVLTPLLNTGLLTVRFVIDETIAYASERNISLNSLEGFVRQLIGWREFIRGVYLWKGTEERSKNFWKFKRKIPDSFWNGTTGILPVDTTIQKVIKTGYCHHIERLMVLGNFMLLCEFDPDDVYRWFMEMFIDAYDWVMVPNVYGMSQFADGGLMATKPYISGSNYIRKMSNFSAGPWQETWDGLFWTFMNNHRDFFVSNPRLGMLIKIWDKMSVEKRNGHVKKAAEFLRGLE